MAKAKAPRDYKAEYERRVAAGYFKDYRNTRRETVDGVAYDLVQNARRRAQAKDIPFEIDPEWVRRRITKQKKRCAVTGMEFEFVSDPRSPWRPSLDRIDSSLGYTPSNTQVVILMLNYCKNDASMEEVRRFARAILEATP